jgi:Glycosyltransferase family 17
MKIVDSFTFWNELDILELRFREHYNHVDRFVICESDYSFTEKYKGFILEQNQERFKQWWDKVVYIKASPTLNTSPRYKETWQRSQLAHGWKDLKKDDVIIISDADEIIRSTAFDTIRNTNFEIYYINMTLFYNRINYVHINYPWTLPKAYRGIQFDPIAMRETEHFPGNNIHNIEHAGWHFSWLGDKSDIIDKAQNSSYTFDTNKMFLDLNKNFQSNKNIFNMEMVGVKIDEYYPQTILNNLEKYQHLILPDQEKSMREIFNISY